MKPFFKLLLLVFFSAQFIEGYSQVFDTTYLAIIRASPSISSISKTPDGGLLFCGELDYYGSTPTGSLLKLDQTGKLVDSFKRVYTDKKIDKVLGLPNGKILIQGDFTKVNGISCPHLVQLNADGSYDNTFNAKATYPIGDFIMQPDGMIIINPFPYSDSPILQRLYSNGLLDQSFSSRLIADGEQVVSSSLGLIIADPLNNLYKLKNDGSIDRSFKFPLAGQPNTSTDTQIYLWCTQPDNKVLVSIGPTLYRINTDGSLDGGFSNPSFFTPNPGFVTVRGNGNILVYTGYVLYELNPDGSVYQQTNVWSGGGVAWGMVELINEKILIIGNPPILLNSDCTIDSGFKPLPISAAPKFSINDFTVSFDGKGFFSNGFNDYFEIDSTHNSVFKTDNFGKRDLNFNFFGVTNPSFSLSLQEDGKLLVAESNTVIRVYETGAMDSTFNSKGIADGNGIITKIFYDGASVLAAGSFNQFAGQTSQSLVRLDKTGSVIQTYKGLPPTSSVSGIGIQSDGKIVVTGEFDFDPKNHVLGSTSFGCLRLNPDGSLDNTFPKSSLYGILDIKIDSQDRIYLVGVNGLITRLAANGQIDNTFSPGSFSNGDDPFVRVEGIEILPDNSIIVGGNFTSYRGTQCNGTVIIKNDGAYLIPSPPLDPSSEVKWIKYAQGSVYVGGKISMNTGGKVGGIAKINLPTSMIPVPQAPKNLQGNYQQSEGLTLKWTYNFGVEDGFKVERSVGDQTNYSDYSKLYSKSFAFNDSAVRKDEKYYYRVSAFNRVGSSTYSNVFVYPDNLIMEVQSPKEDIVKVFPNPVKDYIEVQLDSTFVQAKIFDALGKPVSPKAIDTTDNSARINVTNLPLGVYFFLIETESSLTRIKILKDN